MMSSDFAAIRLLFSTSPKRMGTEMTMNRRKTIFWQTFWGSRSLDISSAKAIFLLDKRTILFYVMEREVGNKYRHLYITRPRPSPRLIVAVSNGKIFRSNRSHTGKSPRRVHFGNTGSKPIISAIISILQK